MTTTSECIGCDLEQYGTHAEDCPMEPHDPPQPLNSEPAQGPVEGRSVGEIRALCDAATPGPWSFYLGDLWAGATADELATADRLSAEHVFSDEAEDIFERASHLFHGDPVRPEDAEFIAAARDLVPQLLAEVEAADRFERSAALERESLLAERRKVTADWELACELLGQRTSELERLDRANAKLALDFAAVSVERDSLRGVVQAVADECSSFGAHTFTVDGRLVVEVDAIVTALTALCSCPASSLFNGPSAHCPVHGSGLAAAADAPQPEDEPTKCASCGRPKNAHSPTRTGGYLTGHQFIDPKDVCHHTIEEGCTGHGDF